MSKQIFRNTCPRNCFGTCGILSHVENGKLIKVTGDPKHGYNQGKLCAKGYASTQYVYNKKRLKYPMLQTPRGSGNWHRITWNEAYSIIANKIIELHTRYGSNLACGYNKFSGNLGILHFATEGMFNSIGPHTKPIGNPCAMTGISAIQQIIGDYPSLHPEDMAKSKSIIIWGANPAITNIHQMKFINEARKNGGTLVVIDPVFTETAKKADLYIQIKPGTDMYLALGIAKIMIEQGDISTTYLEKQTIGWKEYANLLINKISFQEIYSKTGVSKEALLEITRLYKKKEPVATWIGFGLQRSEKGFNSIKAIVSLVVITGNLWRQNGGLYYIHSYIEELPLHLRNHQGPTHPDGLCSREININNFAEEALHLKNPPLKMLWIASRNIATQDQNSKAWKQLFHQLELIITVDLFFTKTTEQSDIILPTTTHFEAEDLHIGYWHHWISINQKAIPPYYEAKSDLQIARELTAKLNELSPHFSNFPIEKEPMDWIKEEFTPDILKRYSLTSFEDLMQGPHQRKSNYEEVKKKMEQIQLFCPKLSKIDIKKESHPMSEKTEAMYQLLTPQALLKIHSQYEMISWLNIDEDKELIFEIPLSVAKKQNIRENEIIEVFNKYGLIIGRAKINPYLPSTVILAPQAGNQPINQLIHVQNTNPKKMSCFFYDSKVQIRKRGKLDV